MAKKLAAVMRGEVIRLTDFEVGYSLLSLLQQNAAVWARFFFFVRLEVKAIIFNHLHEGFDGRLLHCTGYMG
jgi:hypothetical protein